MPPADRQPVPESEAVPQPDQNPDQQPFGTRVPPATRLRVVLILRSRRLATLHDLRRPPDTAHRLHERSKASHPPRPLRARDVEALRAFVRRIGVRVLEWSSVRHDVVLEGTAAAFERAFQVKLEYFDTPEGPKRGHRGPAYLEASLADVVESVLGLDELPAARRALPGRETGSALLWPHEVAKAYRFPACRGRGQKIAVLSFGGGFHQADLEAYFAKTVRGRQPRVRVISVMGANNTPLEAGRLRRFVEDFQARVDPAALAQRHGADLGAAMDTYETTMDVQIAGALAPEALLEVWFAPNTPAGWYAAINGALGEAGLLDGRPRRRHRRPPTALSISWGNLESHWNANRMWAIHCAIELARHCGTTVCCASGDFGSLGLPPGEAAQAGVSFPASSPYALACGGTRLKVAGARVTEEVAWNSDWGGMRMATGGGVSGLFPRPDWQRRVRVPSARELAAPVWVSRQVPRRSRFRGRGIPDVAANADGESGYRIRVGGVDTAGGGTSASTPLWAALVTLLAEQLGRPLGWLNPVIYGAALRRTFRDVTDGHNDVSPSPLGFFRATPGWDAVTGLGTPDGEALLQALRALN